MLTQEICIYIHMTGNEHVSTQECLVLTYRYMNICTYEKKSGFEKFSALFFCATNYNDFLSIEVLFYHCTNCTNCRFECLNTYICEYCTKKRTVVMTVLIMLIRML